MRPFHLFMVLASAVLPAGAQQSDAYTYRIVYTGRLLGYARIPDTQRFESKSGSGEPNSFAKALLDEVSQEEAGRGLRVLVGMGDNLAPDLYARTFDVAGASALNCDTGHPYPASVHVPKDFFSYDRKTESWISVCSSFHFPAPFFDNAAEFFVRAHYDALIPGKHDFYLGAQHLRDVANFLELHGVHMLGENLVVSTNRAAGVMNVHPPLPGRFQNSCHDNYVPHACYSTNFGPSAVELPGIVLPWKQQFVIRNARRPAIAGSNGRVFRADELPSLKPDQVQPIDVRDWSHTYVCVEPGPLTNSDPTAVLVPGHHCFPIRPARDLCVEPLPRHLVSSCKSLYGPPGVYDKSKDKGSPDLTFLWAEETGHLTPGLNHMLCADMQASNPQHVPVCQPFPVQEPFFSSTRPFSLVSRGGGSLAIFGVVSPDLLTSVGMLNATWLNNNKAFDTTTAVIAPETALRQSLELCASIDSCRDAPKILLAQMPHPLAAQLLAHFDREFDAVVSEADSEYSPGVFSLESSEARPRLVLTPAVPFYADAATGRAFVKPVIYEADVSKRATAAWSLSNRPIHDRTAAALPVSRNEQECPGEDAHCTDLQRFSIEVLKAANRLSTKSQNAVTEPAAGSDLTQVTLTAMRDYLKTDVAILQQRDFYAVDRISLQQLAPADLQDAISTILWKGDFISTLHIAGGTLRALLTQSAAFAASQNNPLSTDLEGGRSLITLGITTDPGDSSVYYVNGAKLDNSALYTVAATDFLSAGDTGYGALASPDVPPPVRPRTFDTGPISLAGLVCSTVAAHIPGKSAACLETKLGAGYLDRTNDRPFDDTPGFTTWNHYRAFTHYFDFIGLLGSPAEQSVQERPFWTFDLENLDFGESGVFINHVTRTSSLLAGISTPGVAQNNTSNIAADHRARLTYDFRKGTLYLLSDSSFLSTRTGPGSLTISTNMLGSETGGTVRIPWHRPAWLSAQYSIRYERELVQPPDSTILFALPASQLAPDATAEPTLALAAPKTSDLYGRIGLRAEAQDTYFETGVEEIDARGLLQSYRFNINGAPVYCEPAASAPYLCGSDPRPNSILDATPLTSEPSLTSANMAARATTTSFLDPGIYLNFRWKFPLLSRRAASGVDRSMYFTLTNKGDFYFNSSHDTPVQTRYLTQLTPALLIPIWGNLSLAPRVDFILFENKVNFYHYRAIQPSVSLSYTFRVREGMSWRRALGYGTQTTTPTPAGSLP